MKGFRSALTVLIVVVLGIAAVIGFTWAKGGFAARSHMELVEPGETFDMGPMSMSLDRAEVMDGHIVVYGSCRNTGERSYRPESSTFTVADASVPHVPLGQVTLVLRDPLVAPQTLPPGLAPMECAIQVGNSGPAPQRIAVTVNSLKFSSGRRLEKEGSSESWQITRDSHRVELVVQR